MPFLGCKAVEDLLPPGSIVHLYETNDYNPQIEDGEPYRVLFGFVAVIARDSEGTLSKGIAFSVCTCPEGFQSLPLSLAKIKPKCCKHMDEALGAIK